MIAPNNEKDSKRYSTAIHEAAHGAAVYEYRGRINKISIIPNDEDNTAGRAIYNSALNMPVIGTLAIAFGGGVAVWELEGRKGPMLQQVRCDFDIERAMKVVHALHGQQYGEPHAELIREGLRSAQQTVERQWAAIETVASYLLEHEEMSGLLANAIFRTHDRLEKT